MSWAQHRRYSGPGEAGLRTPLTPAAAPLSAAALQPGFPGQQPHYLSPSSSTLASGHPSPSWEGHHSPLQPEPSCEAAAAASADEEQLQSMLSALRVALGKKEAALVSVAGQLADAQGRLHGCEAERRELAAQLRDLQLASGSATPGRLASAASLTPEGRLLAQARQELGQEAARVAELAAERDALQQDVALMQQQLMAAAQAEAQERGRLCTEATQSRLLARARARQVEQLQAELQQAAGASSSAGATASQQMVAAQAKAASAQAAAADASGRAAAAEADMVQLRQQLEGAQAASVHAEARANGQAEAELAEARQQADWQALRIGELQQTSSVGQLMRKYEGEVQRLRAQFDAERRCLQQQLAQAAQQQHQQAQGAALVAAPGWAGLSPQQAMPDSAAWAELFEEPSQQPAAELQDAWAQTEGSAKQQCEQLEAWADPALLEAARTEIERLQAVNASLLESQTQAQHALQDSLEQQRQAALARDQEVSTLQAGATERQLALDATRRAEAGLRERLSMAERQLAHQSGEVQALREANEKLELAVEALKEELEGAGQVPQQQLEQLQAELRQATASTQSLEAQVLQLKQQAAAASEQLEAAVQQQAQQGGVEAAGKVAAALEAAAVRHGQQTQALQERLIEAHQQLQAARSELSALQQEQQLRRQSMVEQGAQACSPAEAVPAASQTDAWVAPAQVALLPAQAHWQPPPSSAGMHQSPSRGGSACESPAYPGSQQSATGLSVAVTAKQLQLELARVKITPLKPLPGSSLRAGSRMQQAPSRLGSACGEHPLYSDCVSQQQQHQHQRQHASSSFGGGGGSSLSGLAAMQRSAELEAAPGSSGRLGLDEDEEDEDEACFATPLAQTPTAFSAAAAAEASPFSSGAGLSHGLSPALGDGAAGWTGEQRQSRPMAACSHQQHQQGVQVPALDLQLVRPYSSLSCDSYGGPDFGCQPTGAVSAGGAAGGAAGMFHLHAEASTSVSSLSSLGPSASQVACWTPGVAAAGACSPACSRGAAVRAGRASIDSGYDMGLFGGGSIGGASWQSASLDASLARLAQLTAGLRRQ